MLCKPSRRGGQSTGRDRCEKLLLHFTLCVTGYGLGRTKGKERKGKGAEISREMGVGEGAGRRLDTGKGVLEPVNLYKGRQNGGWEAGSW